MFRTDLSFVSVFFCFQEIKIWTILINIITIEVTDVSLMFRKVQGGSFHFCTVPKNENSGFSK